MQITTSNQTFDPADVYLLDYALLPEQLTLTVTGGREIVIRGETEVVRVLALYEEWRKAK